MRAVLLACVLALPAASAEPPVTIQPIKYADLGKAVRAHRGKVVVVDIWASWCVPCRKEFPELVQLHRKHAAEGLVCISLSVDTPEKQKAALDFLQKAEARFANYRLEEGFDRAAEKLGIKSIPAVFVFGRDNKRAGKFTGDDPDTPFSYAKDVAPLVRQLLKAKGAS